MVDTQKVQGISLDLDDTLWPIGPTIARAEAQVLEWLTPRAPMTVALFAGPAAVRQLMQQTIAHRPDWAHDLGAVRRETLRTALRSAGEDSNLADLAMEIFMAARQDVRLYDDVYPALEKLCASFPVVALSNGNANVQQVGLARFFRAHIQAGKFGIGKPHASIFFAAAAAIGVKPAHMLHAGDDAITDVLGGLAAGMQTVWVNRMHQPWEHVSQPHATVSDLSQLCALLA